MSNSINHCSIVNDLSRVTCSGIDKLNVLCPQHNVIPPVSHLLVVFEDNGGHAFCKARRDNARLIHGAKIL